MERTLRLLIVDDHEVVRARRPRLTYAEIAERLVISESTGRFHIANATDTEAAHARMSRPGLVVSVMSTCPSQEPRRSTATAPIILPGSSWSCRLPHRS